MKGSVYQCYASFWLNVQFHVQKAGYFRNKRFENFFIIREKTKIIHVPEISLYPKTIFDVVVEHIKIDICPELAGKISYRQTTRSISALRDNCGTKSENQGILYTVRKKAVQNGMINVVKVFGNIHFQIPFIFP